MADQEASLSPRDRHLFGPGPKRVLALDGGGVRGAVTIAFLARMERLIEEIEGRPVLLGDWFDIIGGTSTGAIIAVGLALGYRVADIYEFYKRLGPKVFRRSRWRLVGRQSLFESRKLMQELESVIGARTLDSADLRTGLYVVCKRMDTGSTWLVSNNPRSHYWESVPGRSVVGNRHYPLVNIVRASTAAPLYFDPEQVEIITGQVPGLFIDGGVSPHNNPSLYLYLATALPQYGLSWPQGPENLTIVSVGTGSFRYTTRLEDLPWIRSAVMGLHALRAQISDSEQLVLALMLWFGESPTRWWINREFGDLSGVMPPGGRPHFRFLRYNLHLEREWLEREMGVRLDPKLVLHYRELAAAENIPALYELGQKAADRQMQIEHLRQPARAPA